MAHDYQMPRMPAQRRPWLWPLLIVLLLLIVVPAVSGIIIDWLWYRELHHPEIFWTLAWGRWILVLAVTLIFFLAVFGNVATALLKAGNTAWAELSHRLSEQSVFLREANLRGIALWGSGLLIFFFAFALGSGAADYWPQFLLYFNTAPVQAGPDPILHRDISFYLMRLPVLEILSTWLMITLMAALILTAVAYLALGAVRFVRSMPVFAPAAQAHLSILLALVFAAKAFGYYLGRFSLLSMQTGSFVGPGYTDVHARIPDLGIMMVLALIAALAMFINIWWRNVLVPITAIVGLILVSILVLGAYPAFLQRFRVDPTELRLEQEYLQHHIDFTRQAYGIDKIRAVDFSPSERVSGADLASSPITMNNIRLWDHQPLLQNYRQRQVLRSYYEMNDVDIDRYQLNGQMRQVMLSPRELNVDNIPGEQTWLNRHLLYTHGYGLAMSPVNAFDPNKGDPVFFIDDIPPQSDFPSLKITRPEIYFGEKSNDYSIVHTSQPEFDYTRGDTNQYTTYQGTAGIPLHNSLVRLLMALHFGSLDLFISGYLTPDSRLLMRRSILERAQALAPFFVYDRDPYMVIGDDGHLYWMLDAYTHSQRYPYAAHASLGIAGNDPTIEVNYLRNPVKVVVDAYNGSLAYYVTDESEPYVRAWRRIFPSLFQPISALPAGLQQHIRVPEGMFNTVSEIYRRYHMTDPVTFYQREDVWDIPAETVTDASGQTVTSPVEAYYLVMSLPNHPTPEYLLIRPYTPSGKQNMVAWLSARNDPDHLGELLVFNFPKQRQIYGPGQVQATIQQNTDISQAVTLWGQAGSRVWWGNLLVIPVNGTILYAQPLYLIAEQSQIPELKRVIVGDQQRVVMRSTLEEALAALTSGTPAAPTPTPTTPTPSGPPTALNASQQALQRSALDHFRRAQDAMHRGDWTTYGKEMEQVGRDLEKLNQGK